jgi:hypothetical protein
MFRLQASPTFTATVRITVPGADEPAQVPFVFRHKGRKALAEFQARTTRDKLDDIDVLMEVIEGWGDDIQDADGKPVPFSKAALQEMLDAYHQATQEIWNGYLQALGESRLGN